MEGGLVGVWIGTIWACIMGFSVLGFQVGSVQGC